MNYSKWKTLQEENGYVTDTLRPMSLARKLFLSRTSLHLALLLSLTVDNTAIYPNNM